jgi:hypothetical protein
VNKCTYVLGDLGLVLMEGPTAIDHRVDRQRHETPAAKTFNPRPPRRPRSSRSCIHSHVLRGGVRSAIVGIATHLRRTNHLRLWLPFCTAFLPKLGPSQMAAFSCAPRAGATWSLHLPTRQSHSLVSTWRKKACRICATRRGSAVAGCHHRGQAKVV